jgi:hypothetical protein
LGRIGPVMTCRHETPSFERHLSSGMADDRRDRGQDEPYRPSRPVIVARPDNVSLPWFSNPAIRPRSAAVLPPRPRNR